jgi:hypothetical protein
MKEILGHLPLPCDGSFAVADVNESQNHSGFSPEDA